MTMGDPIVRRQIGAEQMHAIIGTVPPEAPTLLEESVRDFAYAEVWSRPGLDRRSRRWIALAGAAATGMAEPVEDYVRGALGSGDVTLAEMQEAVLHFAVYSGWPLARPFDRAVSRVATDLGLSADVPPIRGEAWDPAERHAYGTAGFEKVMTFPGPATPSAYYDGGIKNFVFGEMWQRPGLDQRSRRWITLSCVGASGAAAPIGTHVYTAMKAGDATYAEMHEFVLQFAVEQGWPKGSIMQAAVDTMWPRVEQGLSWM
jgi:4-carboxymuconolactone decarboxylase